MKSGNHRTLALLPGAVVAFALGLAPAHDSLAQETAQTPVEPVTATVAPAPKEGKGLRTMRTGSNILRVRTDDSLPLLELDRAYIDRSGVATTLELIRTIPQVQNGR